MQAARRRRGRDRHAQPPAGLPGRGLRRRSCTSASSSSTAARQTIFGSPARATDQGVRQWCVRLAAAPAICRRCGRPGGVCDDPAGGGPAAAQQRPDSREPVRGPRRRRNPDGPRRSRVDVRGSGASRRRRGALAQPRPTASLTDLPVSVGVLAPQHDADLPEPPGPRSTTSTRTCRDPRAPSSTLGASPLHRHASPAPRPAVRRMSGSPTPGFSSAKRCR